MGRRRVLGLMVVAGVLALVACAPAAPGDPTVTTAPPTTVPGPPVIQSFTATPGTVTAPGVVALSWSVTDPEGDPVACLIDGDGDGVDDLTIPDCHLSGSRNVTLGAAGTYTARLLASDGTWTSQRTVTVTASPGPSEPYDIVVRPRSPLSPEHQAVVAAAVARWESVVVRGVPDVPVLVPGAAPACGGINAPIAEVVDDLVIDVDLSPIDGPSGILGQAGPCVTGGDGRARFGVLQLDLDDLGGLSTAELTELVIHEMGHVIGFGTLWGPGLLTGYGSADPRFIGARAAAEWSALGRSGGVPVEAGGGAGTAYAHWRESVFDRELMTGWLDPSPNPLSRVSVASLADLGYQVDLAAADPYGLPFAGLRVTGDALPADGRFVLIRPPA